MGQTNLIRTQFIARENLTSLISDDRHTLAFTGYYQIGDVVDVIDVDPAGNILSVLADNLTILAIDPNVAVTLSAVVDTSVAVGTPQLVCQIIDDGQAAVDRLYRRSNISAPSVTFDEREPILAQRLNTPIPGQTTYYVADTSFWRAGDLADILAIEGLVASNTTIVSVNPNADAANNRSTIVISTVVDTSTFTTPFLLNKTITAQSAIMRNQERIDGIDTPIENEDMHVLNGLAEGTLTAYETQNLFVQNGSKLMIDGRRLKKGTPGTRAGLVQGTGNSQLTFTSMLLGLLGNEVEVRVQAGAGLTIGITKTFSVTGAGNLAASLYRVTINDNGGAATALDIATALNADATVKRIVQVVYGGTGLGVVVAFGPTALAGGLDNGTGDYAELEQIYENLVSATGFKWCSLHIRRNEVNRLRRPPQVDEELIIDYRKATENV